MSERYSRSELFPGIGAAGQARIRRFSIAFVGVGAVGAAAAEMAARGGFGRITLIDRDVVEESNLARQFLFDAEDAARIAPKAEAAAARLAEIDPSLPVTAVVADLAHGNAREVLAGHDLIFDGSDNFETRLLVSDAARALAIPSIYAACVGEEGRVAVSIPGRTPCLRCYLEALPPAGSGPTCDTAGVVPTLPPLVASLAMTEVVRLAAGEVPAAGILTFTVWAGGFRSRRLFERRGRPPRVPSAPAPVPGPRGRGRGRDGQALRAPVRPDHAGRSRAARLRRPGAPARAARPGSPVAAAPERRHRGAEPDGLSRRALRGRGTDDPSRARSYYDRYVGG